MKKHTLLYGHALTQMCRATIIGYNFTTEMLNERRLNNFCPHRAPNPVPPEDWRWLSVRKKELPLKDCRHANRQLCCNNWCSLQCFSFGHPFYDEGTILAPLFQCCRLVAVILSHFILLLLVATTTNLFQMTLRQRTNKLYLKPGYIEFGVVCIHSAILQLSRRISYC